MLTLTIVLLASSPLEIATKKPSSVRSRVERKPTDSTVPPIASTLISSPRSNGRSLKIISEPKKFLTVSCAARPIAKPPTPNPAISGVIGCS